MLTDNFLSIILSLQTLLFFICICGVAGFLYFKNRKKIKQTQVIVEDLPNGINEGFGYIRNRQVLLNTKGKPYLFGSYPEAVEYKKRFKFNTEIIYQKWDLNTKTVFLGRILDGSE